MSNEEPQLAIAFPNLVGQVIDYDNGKTGVIKGILFQGYPIAIPFAFSIVPVPEIKPLSQSCPHCKAIETLKASYEKPTAPQNN